MKKKRSGVVACVLWLWTWTGSSIFVVVVRGYHRGSFVAEKASAIWNGIDWWKLLLPNRQTTRIVIELCVAKMLRPVGFVSGVPVPSWPWRLQELRPRLPCYAPGQPFSKKVQFNLPSEEDAGFVVRQFGSQLWVTELLAARRSGSIRPVLQASFAFIAVVAYTSVSLRAITVGHELIFLKTFLTGGARRCFLRCKTGHGAIAVHR